MCVFVWVWVCGCVGVWMCGRTCRCAMLRFLSLLFSSLFLSGSPASGPAWPMLYACLFLVLLCLLCPAATPALAVTTMCLPILHPFLSLFAKSFLLAVTTSFLLLLHYSFSFLPFSSSFAESLLFPYFLFICVPIPGLFGLHSLPCHWTCSVRRFANSNKHNQPTPTNWLTTRVEIIL